MSTTTALVYEEKITSMARVSSTMDVFSKMSLHWYGLLPRPLHVTGDHTHSGVTR